MSATLLPPLRRFKIVDVGASATHEPPDFARLVAAVDCDIVGFEPIAAECENLMRGAKPHHLYLPYVIGDGSARTFYECSSPYCSSVYEPDIALVEKFQYLEEFMTIVKSGPVETKRLDDIPETEGTDFLKVDVQGAELLVFSGRCTTAKRRARDSHRGRIRAAVQGTTLFADVDTFLRAQGFAFHKMKTWGRTFKPVLMRDGPDASLSQMLWADAVYIRDFMTFGDLPPASLLKLAVILHEVEQSYDLVQFALQTYDRIMKTNLQMSYLRQMTAR